MIEITRETFTLRLTEKPNKIHEVMEAWQRATRLLAGFGRDDHKPEIECRVNGFGHLSWNIEILGPKHNCAWRIPNQWDTWEGIEKMLVEWLADNLPNGCLPHECCGWEFGMRDAPTGGGPYRLTTE